MRALSIVGVCVAALATASAAAAQPVDARTLAADGRMIVLGGLYGGQRIACAQCHGLDGAGDSSGAFPRLSGQSAWYLYKTLQDYASGLRPSSIMGPVARTLTDRQMQQVASHYAAAVDAPFHANADVDIRMRQTGGAIAAAGIAAQGVPACNGCHGPDGHGAPPIYPALAGQFANYTRHQLLLWKQSRRGGDPMKIMEQIAKAMTDEQIEAVSTYYAAVSPSRSRQGEGGDVSQLPAAPRPSDDLPQRRRETNILGLTGHAEPPPPGALGPKPLNATNTDSKRERAR